MAFVQPPPAGFRAPVKAESRFLPKGISGKVVLMVLAAGLVFVGGLFTLVESGFRSSDLYRMSLDQVTSDKRVTDVTGTPLKPGWLISGNMNTSNTTGSGVLTYDLTGPKEKVHVYVEGEKHGAWQIKVLNVRFQNNNDLVLAGEPEQK